MSKHTIMFLSAFAVVVTTPLTAPSVSAQGALAIEEITVTARKRDESLLDVPLAITAFSESDIEKLAIKEITDIVDFSPGFHYAEHSVGRGGRFNRRLLFRGMNPRTDRQTRQGATVFIDGAPMLGSEIGDVSNYERIEVIKGPQSAYFGRSTFSGAINVVTKNPGNEWAGKVSAEAARFGTSDFGAQIEGPLIQDKLAFRLNGSQYNTDGEHENAANPSQRLGAESTTDFGLTLLATPNDNFTAKLRLHYWTDDDGPTIGISLNRIDYPGIHNCSPGGAGAGDGTWICGDVPYIDPRQSVEVDATLTPQLISYFYNPAILATYGIKVPYGMGLERHAQEASLHLEYEFENGMTLTSITAAHENEYASFADIDRRETAGEVGSVFGFPGGPGSADAYQMTITDLADFSQEVRLSSSDEGSLRWMAGASFSVMDYVLTGAGNFNGGPPSVAAAANGRTHDPETTAIFGSVGWDINDQFTLSVEARYQEDKVVEGRVLGLTPDDSATFTSTTPRVILDYKPNEDTTFYLTYAEGTNPGQFNTGINGLSAAELAQLAAAGANTSVKVDEEEITNIEVGVKSRFWDDRAQISATVYFSDWEGLIATELVGVLRDTGPNAGNIETIQSNSNGGQADLSGLELEAEVLLSENFSLEGTLSLTQSELNDFESADAAGLLGDRTIDGLGNELSRYPTTSGSLSGTYQFQAGDYNWYIRGDVIYRGSTWATNVNLTETGDATTVNLKIGFEKDNWRIEAFGTNIFDEEGYTQLQRLADLSGQSGGAGALPGCTFFCPRQIVAGLIPKPVYGLRATFEF